MYPVARVEHFVGHNARLCRQLIEDDTFCDAATLNATSYMCKIS